MRAKLAVCLGLGLVYGASAGAVSPDCTGALGADRIVACLRPTDPSASLTRGIRPAGPPAGTATSTAPTQPTAAPPPAEPAAVNLMVAFAFDSAELTPKGMAALDALAAALKNSALANSRFQIAGHTDAVGAADYNQKLSERRAESAMAYLVQRDGVDAAKLATVGYGSSRPYDAASPGAAINRRVEVIRLEN